MKKPAGSPAEDEVVPGKHPLTATARRMSMNWRTNGFAIYTSECGMISDFADDPHRRSLLRILLLVLLADQFCSFEL
jgi:hypothetical protein